MAGFLHEKQAQVAASRQGDDPDELSPPESAPRLHRPVAVLCREGFRCDKAEECADALGAVFRGFELGEDAPSEDGCCRQFRFVQGAYGGVGRFSMFMRIKQRRPEIAPAAAVYGVCPF